MSMTFWKRFAWTAALVVTSLAMTACGDIYSRDDFVKAVMDKSEVEVSQKFGAPAAVYTRIPERVIWVYERETFDLGNENRRDPKTSVIFEERDGERRVTNVEFG